MRTRLSPLLLSLLLSLSACGPAPAPITPAPAATGSASATTQAAAPADVIEVDSTAFGRIDADVRYLASPELGGRGTGDPGARLAAEMIRTRFQQLGLRPEGDTVAAIHGAATPSAPRASKTDAKLAALHDFNSARYKIRTAREHKAAGVLLVTDAPELPAPSTDPSGMGLPAATILRATAAREIAGVDFKSDKIWDATSPAPPRDLPKLTVSLGTHVEALTADAWNVLGALPAREGSPHASEWVVVGASSLHASSERTSPQAPRM